LRAAFGLLGGEIMSSSPSERLRLQRIDVSLIQARDLDEAVEFAKGCPRRRAGDPSRQHSRWLGTH